MSLPAKIVHPLKLFCVSMKIGKFSLEVLIFAGFSSISFPNPAAARSLAIPLTPRQSGLLGVIAISM